MSLDISKDDKEKLILHAKGNMEIFHTIWDSCTQNYKKSEWSNFNYILSRSTEYFVFDINRNDYILLMMKLLNIPRTGSKTAEEMLEIIKEIQINQLNQLMQNVDRVKYSELYDVLISYLDCVNV